MWKLDYKESWVPVNWCFWSVVLEKTLESPLNCKEVPPVHPKGNQSWIFMGKTDAEAETPNNFTTCYEEPTPWKRPWCWERLKAGGEGDNRGRDGWVASLTQWTWVWVNSGSWWWTGRPGVLQSMELQSVRHGWVTELNWTESHEGSRAGASYFKGGSEMEMSRVSKAARGIPTATHTCTLFFSCVDFMACTHK